MYVFLFGSVILGVIGQLLLKTGSKYLEQQSLMLMLISVSTNWRIVLGLFFYFVSAIFWISLLRKTELSLAYPMLSLGYVFILFFSYFFLGEHISIQRIFGTLLIVLGVITVALDKV